MRVRVCVCVVELVHVLSPSVGFVDSVAGVGDFAAVADTEKGVVLSTCIPCVSRQTRSSSTQSALLAHAVL